MLIQMPTTDADWRTLRLKHIGGSEVAALFGVQRPYQHSAFTLWQVKSGRIPDPGEHPDEEEDERIRCGVIMEPVIASDAARTWDWTIEKGPYGVDDACPGLGASLDYAITGHREEDPESVGPGALECKNVDAFECARTWENNQPTFPILLQLQHQLAATGWKWGAIAAWIGGNRRLVWRYRRRPRVIEQIQEKVGAFWESVRRDIPPDVDGTRSTADALRALYPAPLGEISVQDMRTAEDCAAFLLEREFRRTAETREKYHKARLVVASAGNQRMNVSSAEPDGPAYKVNLSKNGRITVREVSPT